ncbi:MAG: hypothetical protein RLZZ502_629 [Pseudomonadota bacterium]|jgi:hypothetical protein
MRTPSTTLALLLSVTCISYAAVSLDNKAGVSVEPPSNSPKPQATRSLSHDLSKPGHGNSAGQDQTLRCWQNGKLLFESKNVKRLAAEPYEKSALSKLKREEVVERVGDAQPVRVYDFENGLCIVS